MAGAALEGDRVVADVFLEVEPVASSPYNYFFLREVVLTFFTIFPTFSVVILMIMMCTHRALPMKVETPLRVKEIVTTAYETITAWGGSQRNTN